MTVEDLEELLQQVMIEARLGGLDDETILAHLQHAADTLREGLM